MSFDDGELAAEDDSFIEQRETYLAECEDVIPKKRQKLMNIRIWVNNNLINVLLDTGALINCMSQETAESTASVKTKRER